MSSGSRVEIPENFYDITSSMLLVQPEPDYFYAQMWLNAMRASLAEPAEFGLPGRGVPTAGAPYAPEDRDRLMLSSPLSTDVIAAKIDFSGAPGHTVRVNRPAYANTTYTQASRLVKTGDTISTTPITVGSEQNNLTLFRFGGPYDSANSRVAPYAIEAFDAQMGVHSMASMHGKHLKRDFHRFIDAVQVALLDDAATTIYPEGMSADNDATTVGQFKMTYEQISRTEEEMDAANLPTFPDGFRLLVLSPKQCKQLKDDPQYARYAESHPQYNALFPSYVKSVGKFHIFKSTTLSAVDNSSSIAIHRGHAIAPGALGAGMGRPPRVRPNTQDNYGETALVVWLADLAFKLFDNRFVYSVRSSA